MTAPTAAHDGSVDTIGERETGMAEDDANRGDRDLVTLFTKALRALGKAGHADEAMRLGGKAWWALEPTDPRAAERVNGTMHYLARLLEDPSHTDGE